jgi:hypothetical protein
MTNLTEKPSFVVLLGCTSAGPANDTRMTPYNQSPINQSITTELERKDRASPIDCAIKDSLPKKSERKESQFLAGLFALGREAAKE